MDRRTFIAAALAAGAALPAAAAAITAHDFAFRSIEGGPLPLADFAGGPLLVVNTASRCGFTYQYDALQTIWERYRDRGLTVLGVPSDDFGGQELDTEAAVAEFCELNYGIDFPMTAIAKVRGADAHPFYAWALAELGPADAPAWNFHKYLLDAEGRLIGAFPTNVEPTDPRVAGAVEALLPGA